MHLLIKYIMNIEIKSYEHMSVVFNVPIDSINDNSSTDTISSWDSLKHMSLIVS